MSKKLMPKQTVQQVAVEDKKGTDFDLVQIEAFRLQNYNLKQQNQQLRNQIGDRNLAECEWQLKYIQADFENKAKAISMSPKVKSNNTENRAKETSLIVDQTLENLRQQLQQLKAKSSAKCIKDEEKIKKLEETQTSLRKQITELTIKNSTLNSMIETYKQNEASIIKFKQAKDEMFERRQNFDKEKSDSIENQSKIMKDQIRMLKNLKENTEEKQKRKAEESKKYAKLLQGKENELIAKETERIKLQKEVEGNANIINSLHNSFINFLIELTSFQKKIEMGEAQKLQFQKMLNWVGKWKTQKRLSGEWEKVGKNLVSILLNSQRKQHDRTKMQAENEKKVLNDRIKELEKSNLIYQQNIKQLEDQINKAVKEKEKLAAENKNINGKLTQKTLQLQTANKQINKLKMEKTNLEKQLQSSMAQTAKWKKEHQELSSIHEKYKITKQQQLTKNRKTIEDLSNAKQILNNNLTASKKQNEDKQALINQLTKQKNNLQSRVKELQTQISKLTNEKDTLQSEKGQLQTERTALKNKISSLQTELNQLKNTNLDLNRAKIQLTNELQQLKRKVQETLKNNTDLKQKLKQKDEAYASLKEEMKNKQFKFSQFASSLSLEILHQNNNIQLDAIQLPKFAKELTTVYKQAKFYNGSQIIAPERVNFIINALQELTKCKCKNSKLVYRLDPQNTTNFHSYIDKKQNLLVVVKLSNGSIVGGFTNTPLESGVSSVNGRGICFNLNHERVFKPRAGTTQNVTTYDSFYFILGNAEIRLRTGEKKIFSNFGIARSYFDNQDFPRTDFLGVAKSQNNELDIDSYEFFKMEFELQ